MKKLSILILALSVVTFTSCGDDENTDTPTETTEQVQLKGFEPLDLTPYGYNLSLMVPAADIHGEANVILTERGAIEISVGENFGIEIMFGEGDLKLLKTDLKEDLVFKSEIITEEENAIIYKQDIPDSGVKTQHHFYYKALVGTDIYDVRDLIDGEYGEGMVKKMLEAAKTIRASHPSDKKDA